MHSLVSLNTWRQLVNLDKGTHKILPTNLAAFLEVKSEREAGSWLTGKSVCCGSMRTTVRSPTRMEEPGVVMRVCTPSLRVQTAQPVSRFSEKPCLKI